MLGFGLGNKIDGYVENYVVFDLETTGISPENDSIIEISAIKVENGNIVSEFSSLVNPERPIPMGASMINGITDEMVKNEPTMEEIIVKFTDFIGDHILVGHNIHDFDLKFIRRDCEHYLGLMLGNDYIDTLPMARALLPGIGRHRLTDLATYYGISSEGAHRALADCKMNREVYEKLGEEFEKKKGEVRLCPRCGGLLTKRKGKFGEFIGCSGYPNCRYTENISI